MEIGPLDKNKDIKEFVELLSKSLNKKYQFLVGKYFGTINSSQKQIVTYNEGKIEINCQTQLITCYKGKIESVDILITSSQLNIGCDFFINYINTDGEKEYYRSTNMTTLIIGDSEEEVKLEMELKKL